MAMLHTVNKSPFENRSLDSCLGRIKDGAAVLLFEDAIYGAMKGTAVAGKIQSAMEKGKVYVLGPDLRARGMSEDQVLDGINVVDYGGFVDLVTEHDNVQAWL